MSPTARTGLIAFGVTALLFSAGFGVLLLLHRPAAALTARPPAAERSAPAAAPAPAAAAPKEAVAGDPYPECAAVRRWLRTHLNDPDYLEILEWEKPQLSTSPPGSAWYGKTSHMNVRFRARNNFGAKQAFHYWFGFDENGEVRAAQDFNNP
jgi:hypothetical protein